jgi:hypothetical protein
LGHCVSCGLVAVLVALARASGQNALPILLVEVRDTQYSQFGRLSRRGVLPVSGEVATLAAEVVPYASAAAAAYGGAVLAKVRDDAADATVGLGRRLLQRIFGIRGHDEPLPVPIADMVADPADADAAAALRLAVRKALAADPGLQAEVRVMLAQAGVSITASGERSIAAQDISGVAVTGDDATITR